MYDRTILFSNFHPSQISKVQSIALPETPVTVVSFTSFFSAFSGGYLPRRGAINERSALACSYNCARWQPPDSQADWIRVEGYVNRSSAQSTFSPASRCKISKRLLRAGLARK